MLLYRFVPVVLLSLLLVSASTTAAQKETIPDASPTEQVVDTIAAEWAVRSALNLQQRSRDDIIELAVAAQPGTLEQRIARCLVMAETPKSRQVLAKLREARANHPSESVQLLLLELETEILKSSTVDIILAQAFVDRVRTNLVARYSSLDVMDAELAAAVVRTEVLLNNAMTPELAKTLVKYHVARAASIEKEVQAAKTDTEIFMNDAISPSRAAFLVKATSLLEKARTPELDASRKKVKTLLAEAVASDPDASKAFAIANQAATEQLSKSRKSVEARIKDAMHE